MLVYISILTLVSGGALTMLFSLGDQINTARADRLLSESAQTTLERMLGDIRAADAVDTFGSTLEVTPGTLSLTQGASTTAYTISGSAIVVSDDGNVIGPLTDDHISVDKLRFYRYDNGTTELARVIMQLTATVGDISVTRTFEAAATLRGSYE